MKKRMRRANSWARDSDLKGSVLRGSVVRGSLFRGQVVRNLGFVGLSLIAFTACQPRVELVAPEKPITINMNIKIDHEVKVNIEKDLDKVISKDSKLF